MERSKEFLKQEQKYNEIDRLEQEIKSLKDSIDFVGNGKQYFNVFQLDKDDFKALIEVRKTKIKNIESDL